MMIRICLSPALKNILPKREIMPNEPFFMALWAVSACRYGGDCVRFMAGRIDLTVVDADDVEDKITVGQQ